MSKKSIVAPKSVNGLVGYCFHIFDDNRRIERQGTVRAQIGTGYYLVQYFEWFVGEPSVMQLVTVEQMLGWQFYEDSEHMKFWYEHRYHEPKQAAE